MGYRIHRRLGIEELEARIAPGAVAVALHRLRERFRRAIFGAEDET